MNNNISKFRNFQIDGFRTILCFSVVFYHIFQRYYELRYSIDFSNYNLPNSFSVVSIFFIISGFFVSLENYKKFWFSKIKWIVIPYLLAITFLFVLQIICRANFSLVDIFANYTIFPLITGLFKYIDGAHWYIVYLLYFFVVIFLLDFLEKKFHKKQIITELFLIGISFGSFVFMFINIDNFFVKMLKIVFNRGFLFLILGIFTKKVFYDKSSYFYNYVFIVLTILSLIVMASIYGITSFILWIALFVIFGFLINESIPWLGNKFFAFIGSHSLWIYLLHEVTGFLLCDFLISHRVPILLSSILTFIVVFSFPIAVSVAYKKVTSNVIKKYASTNIL